MHWAKGLQQGAWIVQKTEKKANIVRWFQKKESVNEILGGRENPDQMGPCRPIKDSAFYSKSHRKPKNNFKQKVTKLDLYF